MTPKQQAKLRAKIKEHVLNIDIKEHETGTATVLAYTKIGKFGIKIYEHHRDRNFGFCNQNKYHKQGMAPRAYFRGTVKFDTPKSDSYGFELKRVYYYVTDHATEYWAANRTERNLLKQEWKKLRKKMKSLCISVCDYSHNLNTGLLSKRIVMIDFDNCSLRRANSIQSGSSMCYAAV